MSATSSSTVPYVARAFTPVHPDLKDAAGVPAGIANERYVESLARIVYYWGYPAVDTLGRTSAWEVMKSAGPGGDAWACSPARRRTAWAISTTTCRRRNAKSSRRTTTRSTASGSPISPTMASSSRHPSTCLQGITGRSRSSMLFTTVTHQLGSASHTPGGKFLLVGPAWKGSKPEGFIDVLRSPTNLAGAFGRSFAAHSAEAKQSARAVLNQIGMYPLSEDKPGRRNFDCEASARNKVYPPGVTAEMIAADPDMLRVRPVDPANVLGRSCGKRSTRIRSSAPTMRRWPAQARTLARAARQRCVMACAARPHCARSRRRALHDSAQYHAGRRRRRQRLAAPGQWRCVGHRLVRPCAGRCHVHLRQRLSTKRSTSFVARMRRAMLLLRTLSLHDDVPEGRRCRPWIAPGAASGRCRCTTRTTTCWRASPNGRHNIGTVDLDADELQFAADGSLTLHLSHSTSGGRERAGQLVARTRCAVRADRAHVRAQGGAHR